jgi:hypothetical protein
MEDTDVLVPTSRVFEAMSLLSRNGWKSVYFERPETRTAIIHSTPFRNVDGNQLDLHWHVFWECFNAHEDQEYWDRAVPIRLGEASTLALNPTDQLLHTCWHGARWNEIPPIRWVADAHSILSASSSEIDWNKLIVRAKRHRVTLPLKDSLSYLQRLLNAPIPDNVVKELAATPTLKIEEEGYAYTLNPIEPPTTRKILRLLYYDYLWLRSSTRTRSMWLAFARFLQAKWNMNYLWQVPFYLPFRIVRRALRDTLRLNDRTPASGRGMRRQQET